MPNNDAAEAIEAYLRQEPDEDLRKEAEELLRALESREVSAQAEVQERFVGNLSFGTAGIRARMESGFRRLNRVTAAKAAFAIGSFFLEKKQNEGNGIQKPAIVVGHDARLKSDVFAEEVSSILRGLGFDVYAFSEPIATPICAFAITHLHACAGVMVTASHNPPADNGLKVYRPNGAQIVSPDDRIIETKIKETPEYQDLPRASAQSQNSLWQENVLDAYFQFIAHSRIAPDASRSDMRVVYTAMHGVGYRFLKEALSSNPFVDLLPVESQKDPDGTFPTLLFPNPEEEGALDLALRFARLHNADAIVANDPDVDRLAVAVPHPLSGDFKMLSGNELGAILGCDVLENMRTEKKKLVISTLVSSRLLSAMAKTRGASYAESLTGFSRIAQIAFERERNLDEQYVFGFEEALGYCIGDLVRDKDGISAAVRLLDRLSLLKAQGKSVWDELDRIALAYGLFRNLQWSFRFSGVDPDKRMQAMMNKMRKLKSGELFFFGERIDRCYDLLAEKYQDFAKANVLVFFLRDGTRVVVRPSGTEPKVKFYAEKSIDVSSPGLLEQYRENLDRDLQNVRDNVALVLKEDVDGAS